MIWPSTTNHFYRIICVIVKIVSLQNELLSYTLSREFRVVEYRYSRLLFTSEDRFCADLRV